MNKKVMTMNKGFTLIETIVSIALISAIMTVLSFGVASSYREYISSNAYKRESDTDLLNIQQPYTNDSTIMKKSVDYTMTTKTDGKENKISLAMYNSTNKDDSISLSRFEAQQSNFKKSNYFTYYTVDPNTGKLKQITELNNYTISSYEDLPTTNYDALNEMNKTWGPWCFIGWSLARVIKGSNGTSTVKDVKKDIMSYTDKGKTLYCGNPNYASKSNGYLGVINEANYKDIVDAIDNGTINLNDYALLPAYFFSQDVAGTAADTVLLTGADGVVRRDMDARNMKNLAKAAAQYIREKGTDGINSDLNGAAQNAIYGKGLEIVHFRENGWPQVARWPLWNGNGSMNSDYENKPYYQNQTKIDNGSTWKTGFIYETFHAIGYDIKETDDKDDWLGIHYKYNILMFGDQVKDNKEHPYSMFMQVNKTAKTVRIWVGTVSDDGSLGSIGGYYDVTASYA